MPILLYGLDACSVSSRQLGSLNYVVVSCARKKININSPEPAAECIKMFDISDIAETVAMRKDRFIKTCLIAVHCVEFAVPFQDVNFVVKLFFIFLMFHCCQFFGE